jgi:hypothetical protein
VTLGRPRRTPPKIIARIKRERATGLTLVAIAAGLSADNVPTAHGAPAWTAETVRKITARPAHPGHPSILLTLLDLPTALASLRGRQA